MLAAQRRGKRPAPGGDDPRLARGELPAAGFGGLLQAGDRYGQRMLPGKQLGTAVENRLPNGHEDEEQGHGHPHGHGAFNER